ncbi:SAF domain-containing protein [Propionimicrobium sp. PCR01-08-3]|uniref:SAF domain-containing protein n=1 Tax=Propionimicrobium sp. PCR01-08-3 TaxID=3052086 RepID=UPI00255C42C4|nr:SAF domain-containing protein [Propionimicrobium sp. PCR01-08-3]WIY82882.1 SAF domain-containing protein [Propionimicrobium sp. PCR01-08-3]
MNPASAFNRLARFLRWHRRGLGIAAAMVCLFAILSVLTPAKPESTPVLVASHALTAGSTLTAADITTIEMPIELMPAEALSDPDEVVGRVLTATLTQGSVLTGAAVLSSRDMTEADERLVPFRVPDAATVALLHVGDRISVVGSSSDGGVIDIATDVRIAALPTTESGSLGGESGALVVVAADAETAAQLAAASNQMRMGIVMQ